MSRAWASGSTRRWRRIRAHVLAHNLLPPSKGGNNGQCTQQIEGVCTGRATQVHHTQGRAITGDDPAYLTATCAPCNLAIGNPVTHDPAPRQVTQW
jgi:hypothetical protein